MSIAASIVTSAAERIGDFDPQDLLHKLESEKIREDWQLEYLDSQQWQMLGVPMGLVASIRRSLVERKQNEQESRSPLTELSPRKKTLTPSLLTERLVSLDETTYSPSSNHSPTSIHTMLSQPPVMPTRRESQALDSSFTSSKKSFSDIGAIREHPFFFPDAVPPTLPQRLKSLDFADLER